MDGKVRKPEHTSVLHAGHGDGSHTSDEAKHTPTERERPERGKRLDHASPRFILDPHHLYTGVLLSQRVARPVYGFVELGLGLQVIRVLANRC